MPSRANPLQAWNRERRSTQKDKPHKLTGRRLWGRGSGAGRQGFKRLLTPKGMSCTETGGRAQATRPEAPAPETHPQSPARCSFLILRFIKSRFSALM
jgi:hypothetical protein